MTISSKHVVAISYSLSASDKEGTMEFIEQTEANDPMVFLFGSSGLLPEFERNLHGKSVGESFDFRIAAEHGYGDYEIENVVAIPKESFLDENGQFDAEMIALGKMIPMTNGEGHRLMGKVLEINQQEVKMDFNHPLSGKELHFTGEVLQIRLATDNELAHGHAHGMDGHDHHH